MEGWDSFLRSLKIAILILQEMLESAAGFCKGGGENEECLLFKGPKASKGPMFVSPLALFLP